MKHKFAGGDGPWMRPIPECVPCAVVEEAEVARGVRDPGQPTQAERDEHDLTHCPFRAWCGSCVRGQAKDDPHRKVAGEFAESDVTRVSMDYCFFTEEVVEETGDHGSSSKASESLTTLLMQESLCGSVWVYFVES